MCGTFFCRSKHRKVQNEGQNDGHVEITCVRVKINKHLFEPFCVWILFQNANSHSVSDFYSFVELKHAVIFMTMTDKIPVSFVPFVAMLQKNIQSN